VARVDSRFHPRIAPNPGGSDQFSHLDSFSLTETEILRTADAIRQAGCRDVLIVSTPEYVRFVVTIKLPKAH
jgi:hypothetical protein